MVHSRNRPRAKSRLYTSPHASDLATPPAGAHRGARTLRRPARGGRDATLLVASARGGARLAPGRDPGRRPACGSHRLAHRQRARGGHPRRRARCPRRARMPRDGVRDGPDSSPAARPRRVERRGRSLREPLRLARVHRAARDRADPGHGRRGRRAAGRRDGPGGLRRAPGTGGARTGGGGGRVRRAPHRAGPPARGSGHSDRRRGLDRRRAPGARRLHRPGRPRGHHADGPTPRRLPRGRRLCAEGARPRGQARRRAHRHELRRRHRAPGREQHRTRAR